MITTDTHTITAYYVLNNGIDSYEIATNGNTLDEIITDMLEFLNGMPEWATRFEVTSDVRTDDEFKVTIEGEIYHTNEDGYSTDETDTMTITIEGWRIAAEF